MLQRTLLAPQPLNVKREKRRMRHQLQLAVLLLGSTGIWIAQLVLQVGHFLQKTNTSTKKKKSWQHFSEFFFSLKFSTSAPPTPLLNSPESVLIVPV